MFETRNRRLAVLRLISAGVIAVQVASVATAAWADDEDNSNGRDGGDPRSADVRDDQIPDGQPVLTAAQPTNPKPTAVAQTGSWDSYEAYGSHAEA